MAYDMEADFWKHVRKGGPDECWEWITKRRVWTSGYAGFTSKDGATYTAHRLAYTLANGPIPDGLFVCHRCDNPLCCNPAHLFLDLTINELTDCPGGRVLPSEILTLVLGPDPAAWAAFLEATHPDLYNQAAMEAETRQRG